MVAGFWCSLLAVDCTELTIGPWCAAVSGNMPETSCTKILSARGRPVSCAQAGKRLASLGNPQGTGPDSEYVENRQFDRPIASSTSLDLYWAPRRSLIISPAGFEDFFAELVDLGGVLRATPSSS
jgi:hypothetical protein